MQDIETREAARLTIDRTVEELELTKRATVTLKKAEVNNVGDIMEKMALGESALLEIDGFGRKSLADLKKRLRQIGYELPEAMEEIVV
ncbi:MAG: DNA-directed RNA polymerase subunit alpha C-terminal domain-containing protein [Anaerolineales bacterium]